RPLRELLPILPQSVLEHLRTGTRADFCLIERCFALSRCQVLRSKVEPQQPTLDASVEQRVAASCMDAERLCDRRIARQHRRLPANEMLAELRTQRGVKRFEPLSIADPLAVRRIRRQQAVLAVFLCELRELAPLEMHAPAQFRAL